jgi:hypothetical protein
MLTKIFGFENKGSIPDIICACFYYFTALFRIPIRMVLGIPDPDPLVRGTDPDTNSAPDPSIIKQK